VAFDYRGRGRSAWDRRRDGYNPLTETNDIFDGMAALNVSRAVIVGTSRGGIIGMMMGTMRPAAVAGLVLNDIGPAVEARGLARLKTYVGRTPVPDDWADAARIQRRLHGGAFTAWGQSDWDSFARLTYAEEAGQPKSDYDPALAATLAGVEFDRPIPALWDEFGALKDVPILAIRGANSDLLSQETLAAMVAAHPSVETITVPDEGHPPLLRGSLLPRIAVFIARVEGASVSPDAVVAHKPADYSLDKS
jgi:pimeloyl-ACP methyl ester carboxylesterase